MLLGRGSQGLQRAASEASRVMGGGKQELGVQTVVWDKRWKHSMSKEFPLSKC